MHLDMRWTAGKITAPFNIANKQSTIEEKLKKQKISK